MKEKITQKQKHRVLDNLQELEREIKCFKEVKKSIERAINDKMAVVREYKEYARSVGALNKSLGKKK